MHITHYDLFAGIGGFSLALEEVYPDATIKHIFCEWESFPTSVLRHHWPDGEFWGDIAELVAHTDSQGLQGQDSREPSGESGAGEQLTIVTGGFPCQPFSHAGRRKGTADDRYQWPNMYAVIRRTKPEWVIAENVRGFVTWNDGLVLETVCADLEAEGYEVQPFIIPACAVGAPHRRDRVWIIGHSTYSESDGQFAGLGLERQQDAEATEQRGSNSPATDTGRASRRPRGSQGTQGSTTKRTASAGQDKRFERAEWERDWQEVAFATCDDAVDDGLPRVVDGVPISRARWRKDSLKAYGNGIVQQVATEIIRAIR